MIEFMLKHGRGTLTVRDRIDGTGVCCIQCIFQACSLTGMEADSANKGLSAWVLARRGSWHTVASLGGGGNGGGGGGVRMRYRESTREGAGGLRQWHEDC